MTNIIEIDLSLIHPNATTGAIQDKTGKIPLWVKKVNSPKSSLALNLASKVVAITAKKTPVKKQSNCPKAQRNLIINPGYAKIDGINKKRYIAIIEYNEAKYIDAKYSSYLEIINIFDLEITSLKGGRVIISASYKKDKHAITDSIIIDVTGDDKNTAPPSSPEKADDKELVYSL